METIAAFEEYQQSALAAIDSAQDEAQLEEVRIEFLGKKKGKLKDLQSLVGKATPEERPVMGQQFNKAKTAVSEALEQRKQELAQPKLAANAIDVTLPGTSYRPGHMHPITQTMEEFKDIMGRLGFSVLEGPEIEDEKHNFESLNIPPEHPARDPLDNFYLSVAESATGGPVLLRSQTSTVQIRVMEKTKPPVRIVSLGRVYRPDTIDATHHCMFHQMEGLMIGDDINMAHLKTTLRLFANAYLGEGTEVRFRTSFFPFTEPSVEVDLLWDGNWMEIGGAGMVDPNVLRAVGYDPETVSGFAFGLGIERFCMRRHNITDIRRLTENDLRFLEQF